MPYIHVIPPEAATGLLKQQYSASSLNDLIYTIIFDIMSEPHQFGSLAESRETRRC